MGSFSDDVMYDEVMTSLLALIMSFSNDVMYNSHPGLTDDVMGNSSPTVGITHYIISKTMIM